MTPHKDYSWDDELGVSYTPKPLMKRTLSFSPKMLSLVSRAECSFSRLDEYISHSANKLAVNEMLLNLESLAAALIDGDSIDLIDLLVSNTMSPSDRAEKMSSTPNEARAIQYKDLVRRHSSPVWAKPLVFDRDLIFSLHSELSYSNPKDFESMYRGELSPEPEHIHKRLPQKRTIPPSQIPAFMDDLCSFCNQEIYSPQIQACLPHFQLEYIKPFKSNIEGLGRHISYIIYARRGFCQNIIIPAALTSLSKITMPVDRYKVDDNPLHQPMSLWIEHGAKGLEQSTLLTKRIDSKLSTISQSWRGRIPNLRSNDLCNILLKELLINPVVNGAYVTKISGKTLPAVGNAINKLTEYGILTPLSSQKRYRVFYAKDVIDFYRELFDAYAPPQWVPGQTLFAD